MNQEILTMMLGKFKRNYSHIFQFLDSLESVEELDLSQLERNIIYDLSNDDLDLRDAYRYADKYNSEFRKQIDSAVIRSGKNLLVFLLINDVDEEVINNNIVRVFKRILYDREEERALVSEFKIKMEGMNLYESTVDTIKKSRDVNAIIPAALIYDSNLIEEIFGSKLNLYYYILSSSKIEEEEKECLMNYILEMNNNEVEKQINKKIKVYEDRINQF